MKILVIGATGTIGQHVVRQAVEAGHLPVAVTRRAASAQKVFGGLTGVEVVEADITDAEALSRFTVDIDAVILTHGGDSVSGFYSGVLKAVTEAARPGTRFALMSSINITHPAGPYAALMREKFAGEEVLRASGFDYTIVRPGWFGGSGLKPIVQQGDTQEYGPVADSVVAAALLEALSLSAAVGKTFELFSEEGSPETDWESKFAVLKAD